MIDTDKYEGHTPGPWKIYYDKWNKTGWWIDSIARNDVGEGDDICRLYGTAQNKDPTAKLVADAPLLLAEVKRLRKENERIKFLTGWDLEDSYVGECGCGGFGAVGPYCDLDAPKCLYYQLHKMKICDEDCHYCVEEEE